jgi:mono/diheme cytochrome c family protein
VTARLRTRLGTAAAVGLLAVAVTVSAQPPFTPAQDPLAGSRVFGAKGCITCHAINGTGGTVGPDLARIARPRTFFDLAAGLWNHAPRMAERMRQLNVARPRLESGETGDLVAFLFSVDYFDPPGRPDVGRRLFAEKRCIVCHQVGGTGGVIGPSLDALKPSASPISLAAAMWNHGPQMAEVMRARGIARPSFQGRDLADLLAYAGRAAPAGASMPVYVLPGRSEAGRAVFAEKRCVDCHSVRGQGGHVGPDLAERTRQMSLNDFATAMWNKAPAMIAAMKARAVPVPAMKPEEMADLLAYLYSERYFAASGDPRQGLQVATAKGCFACHALGTERGKPAGDLLRARGLDSPPAVLAALWNHSFVAPPAGARTPWAAIGPDEMAHLTAYLRSLRRTP